MDTVNYEDECSEAEEIKDVLEKEEISDKILSDMEVAADFLEEEECKEEECKEEECKEEECKEEECKEEECKEELVNKDIIDIDEIEILNLKVLNLQMILADTNIENFELKKSLLSKEKEEVFKEAESLKEGIAKSKEIDLEEYVIDIAGQRLVHKKLIPKK